MTNKPADHFINGLSAFKARFDDVTQDASLIDPDSSIEYLQAVQEMQIMNMGIESSLKSRNSLLKKIMTEIR